MFDFELIGLRLNIESPLSTARIPVPKVWRAESPARLEWTQEVMGESPPLAGCLSSFIRLADASDERIEAFAQRWGVLGICEHGKPGMHDGCMPLCFADRTWELPEEQAAWYRPGGKKPGYWEPISAWRYHARQLAAYLGIVADLQHDEATAAKDWATIHTVLPAGKLGPDWDAIYNRPADTMDSKTWTGPAKFPGRQAFLPPGPARQRRMIAQLITYMFRDAALTPRLVWDEAAPHVTLELGGRFAQSTKSLAFTWPRNSLYSVLVCQLAAAATSELGSVRCAMCRLPAQPLGYRPRHDRRFLCSKDCRDAAHRLVNAASARRRYAARRDGAKQKSP